MSGRSSGILEWLDVDSVSGFRVRGISRGLVDPFVLQYSAIKLQGTGGTLLNYTEITRD